MLATEKVYYDRHLKLSGFGETAQKKLFAAKVLVVGAGGLGCPLLQYLVTAGIGQIGIIDGDVISASNLHRQVLYTPDDLGRPKAETAARKLTALQPLTQIKAYNQALNPQNALEVISEYDLVIDGTDNFESRYLINDACVISKKPFVSGGINDYSGQLSVFNYQGGPTYRCLFPEAPTEEDCFSCAINGVLNVLPGIIALYMANEAIKVVTQYGEVLSGKVMVIDIRYNQFQLFDLEPQSVNQKITKLPSELTLLSRAAIQEHIEKDPNIQLIDVRETWEFEENNLGGVNIPLHDLPFRKAEIATDAPIIFLCQTGKRSRYAAKIFEKSNASIYIAKMDD